MSCEQSEPSHQDACSRCGQRYVKRDRLFGALGGHTPDQCIDALLGENQRLRAKLKVTVSVLRIAARWSDGTNATHWTFRRWIAKEAEKALRSIGK